MVTGAGTDDLFGVSLSRDADSVRDGGDDVLPPLAVRMRPRVLAEVRGQGSVLRPGSPLRRLVEGSAGIAGPVSAILWGPPGTGKTTLAHLTAQVTGRRFVQLSAVTAGVKDVRTAMDAATRERAMYGRQTVLFLDEIHRFSKAQQDALLPGVENRDVILVAATTENPSFSVISPLLSRSLLVTLQPLTDQELGLVVDDALTDPRGLGGAFTLDSAAKAHLIRMSLGDARRALTTLEAAAGVALDAANPPIERGVAAGDGAEGGEGRDSRGEGRDGRVEEGEDGGSEDGGSEDGQGRDGEDREDGDCRQPTTITLSHVEQASERAAVRYDRGGDQHYDVASAFIKSMRGSDVDAALHYLARMIEAGEDPRFIARRVVISASEEIGMADPTALQTAVAAMHAVAQIGLPEARLILAQGVVHNCLAPKSNAVYLAVDSAISDVRAGRGGQVPSALRGTGYPGASRLGHGAGYRYAHDESDGVACQQYLPDDLVDADYYHPTDRGFEERLGPRWRWLREGLGKGGGQG